MHDIINNICTIIGSLVGIGGLVVSIISLKKSKKVEKELRMYTNEIALTQTDSSKTVNKLNNISINGDYTGRDKY